MAAISGEDTVWGASDRMLTVGDILYQPPHQKSYAVTSSIAMMIAGDGATQYALWQRLRARVKATIDANPQNWLNVRDVSDWYGEIFREEKAKRAAAKILAPLGLSEETFLARQATMAAGLVDKIATELTNYSDEHEVMTIFAGVDSTGPHIYVSDGLQSVCRDVVGFAAIGTGWWHAASQFMFAGHARTSPMAETLLRTYSAKRRAEAAPGVGQETDMFGIGPNLGSFFWVNSQTLGVLKGIFEKTQTKIAASEKDGLKRVKQYVDDLQRKSAAAPPAPPQNTNGSGEASPDEKPKPTPPEEEGNGE